MASSEAPATPSYLNIDRENHPAVLAGKRSRDAVIARDKAAWLANFAADGKVEDPVGPSMFDEEGRGHQGADQLAAFWDKTIGASETIEFHFDREIVCGDEAAYIGKIVTHIAGHVTEAEGVFTYRVDAAGDLIALRAFWEVEATLKSLRPA